MKRVKHPKWDKQEQNKTILFNQDGPRPDPPLETSLKAGQRAMGTIDDVEVAVKVVNPLNPTTAEAVIIRIKNEVETVSGLVLGDLVFIERSDMKWLEVS